MRDLQFAICHHGKVIFAAVRRLRVAHCVFHLKMGDTEKDTFITTTTTQFTMEGPIKPRADSQMDNQFVPRYRQLIAIGMVVTIIATFLWTVILVGFPGSRGASLFNWHPIIMSVATLLFLPASVLSWKRRPAVRDTEEILQLQRKVTVAHAAFAVIAFIMLNIGISVAYVSHVQQGFSNLYSLHAWTGLAAVLAILINVVASAFGSVLRCARLLLPIARHRFLGTVAVGLTFASAVLGFAEIQIFVIEDKGPWSPTGIIAALLAVLTSVVGLAVMAEANYPDEGAGYDKLGDGEGDVGDLERKGGMPPIVNVSSETRELSSGSASSR